MSSKLWTHKYPKYPKYPYLTIPEKIMPRELPIGHQLSVKLLRIYTLYNPLGYSQQFRWD